MGRKKLMIISVTGEFYVYETDALPSREELCGFFQGLNENDILEIRIKSPDGLQSEQVYHVTKHFLVNEQEFMDLTVPFSADTFQTAAHICPYNGILPVKDEEGNCISIVKKIWTYYEHFYKYEGEVDLSFLNQYSTIILTGVNEYSVEIYRRVLPLWSGGTQVYLVGAEWKNYLPVLPKPEGIFVEVFEQLPAFLSPEKNKGRGNLYIIEGLPRNESSERYEKGCMYYDEIMQLTFMFSYVIHPGKKNPHKKFFLIDGFYRIEGMFGIWNKAFTAARYAMAKGYTPVFEIVSSDANMYSDHEGDDIWNKFFMQPVDCPLSEIHESSYLALSPNMNILNTVRSIMDKVSGGWNSHGPMEFSTNRSNVISESGSSAFFPARNARWAY